MKEIDTVLSLLALEPPSLSRKVVRGHPMQPSIDHKFFFFVHAVVAVIHPFVRPFVHDPRRFHTKHTFSLYLQYPLPKIQS